MKYKVTGLYDVTDSCSSCSHCKTKPFVKMCTKFEKSQFITYDNSLCVYFKQKEKDEK